MDFVARLFGEATEQRLVEQIKAQAQTQLPSRGLEGLTRRLEALDRQRVHRVIQRTRASRVLE